MMNGSEEHIIWEDTDCASKTIPEIVATVSITNVLVTVFINCELYEWNYCFSCATLI